MFRLSLIRMIVYIRLSVKSYNGNQNNFSVRKKSKEYSLRYFDDYPQILCNIRIQHLENPLLRRLTADIFKSRMNFRPLYFFFSLFFFLSRDACRKIVHVSRTYPKRNLTKVTQFCRNFLIAARSFSEINGHDWIKPWMNGNESQD